MSSGRAGRRTIGGPELDDGDLAPPAPSRSTNLYDAVARSQQAQQPNSPPTSAQPRKKVPTGSTKNSAGKSLVLGQPKGKSANADMKFTEDNLGRSGGRNATTTKHIKSSSYVTKQPVVSNSASTRKSAPMTSPYASAPFQSTPASSLLMAVASNTPSRPSAARGNSQATASASRGRGRPLPPQTRIIPGAVAVDGAEASLADDEYTLTPSPADEQLVTAELVDDSEDVKKLQEELRQRDQELEQVRRDQANIAVGQVVDVGDDSENEDSDKFCLCASKRNVTIAVISVALVVVGIIVAVVVAPTTNSTPQSDSSTAPPTASPTSALPNLIELLSSVSFDGGEALQTPSTPQNNAVLWLANNTNLGIYSDRKKIQRYVLATLYYSTNGNNWTYNSGWMSDLDECGWWNDADDGPFCYNGSVVKLDFYHRDTDRGNNLVGTIPNELALLSDSVDLIPFGDNRLNGQIPSEIGLLTKLTALWLWGNELTGHIPSEIASLTNLNYLQLTGNSFTGEFTCPAFIDYCWVTCRNANNVACRSL